MPSREEEEYSPQNTVRERRSTTASEREPVQPAVEVVVPIEAVPQPEKPEATIDEVLSRLVIHDDRPIENLPTMTAPELKLIGRCVSLSTRQTIDGATSTYYYTGLVAAVTSAAVTLMYVNRYSEEDFKTYKERERAAAQALRSSAQETAKRSHDPEPSSHKRTASAEIDRDQNPVGVQENKHYDAAGSLAPAVAMTMESAAGEKAAFTEAAVDGEAERDGAVVGSTQALRPPHFRRCAGSVGPLPYVSFLRKSIHDVSFGRDPRSSFYSLFSDPEKRLLDMQFLRMFVRRYLVHTSEGNNPRQVPLYAFVTVRGACPDLDRSLVNELVHEELPVLMRADKAIEKDKKRNQSREARRDLAIQEYRAPPGLFSNTGILYLTRVPQSTFLAAAVMVLFTVAFGIYLAITLAVLADSYVVGYMASLMSYFVASLAVWILGGLCIGLHAVNMHIPLRDDRHLFIARIAVTAGGVACCVMTIIVILGKISTAAFRWYMVYRGSSTLCAFYDRNSCSGLVGSCAPSSMYIDAAICSGCPSAASYERVCYYIVWSQIQTIFIPLLVFIVFIFLAVIHSVFQFLKLGLIVRAISGRLEV